MTDSRHPLYKVAVLVSALDAAAADALLDKMPAEQADRVRGLVMHLPEVSDAEQEQVLQEFLQSGPAFSGAGDLDDGVELDASLVEKLAAMEAAVDLALGPALPATTEPGLLHTASPDELSRYLVRERPATIAAVLSQMDASRGGKLLASLPLDIQRDVARRLLEQDLPDSDCLREIERQLEQYLESDRRGAAQRQHGLSLLRAMLADLPDPVRAQILEELPHAAGTAKTAFPSERPEAAPSELRSEHSRSVAVPAHDPARACPQAKQHGRPQPTTCRFADLIELDEHAFSQVWREVDPQVALLALAGAPPEFMRQLNARLTNREARGLAKQMAQLGPVHLRDLEAAQQQVVRQAVRLIEAGRIRLPRRAA